MIKIGFDGKRALFNRTGLGNYSRLLIKDLIKYFPENDYFLFTPQAKEESSINFHDEKINYIAPKKPLSKSLWRSMFMLKDIEEQDVDLFHGLSNELPFGISSKHIPSVVTIHDLIFLRYPDYYPLIDRKIYEIKFKNACLSADTIIAASEQTKRDIQHFFNIKESKIKVIYQSCDPIFSKKFHTNEYQTIKEKHHLPDKFLLNVGTIEARKNLLVIINALKLLPAEIKLVCIGKETEYIKEVRKAIQNHKLGNRVIFLKNIEFKELAMIYHLADIFIYPSEFEGFGIPILEALQSGIPIIAAKGSCLEEVGGPQSLYIKPHDSDTLAQYILHLWNLDPRLRKQLIEQGDEHAKKFDNKLISKQLMDLYMETIQDKTQHKK